MISNKYIHENNQDSIDSKDKINVGLVVIAPFVTMTTIEDPSGKSKKVFGGFLYDIWTVIKKLNNLTDQVTEIPLGLNYDKSVDDVVNGKYDVIIGNFWTLRDRVTKVYLSRPIFISRIVILFKPTHTKLETISTLFFNYFIVPMTIIIILGLIFGYGLYLIEPKRGFMRSTRTATATFFGEAGYLFENSTLNIKALFYIYVVMSIAYFFNIVLQGFVTTDIMKDQESQQINVENIEKIRKPFVGAKTLDLGEVMERYDVNFEALDVQHSELPEFYLRNTDKYAGFITDYDDAKNTIEKYPELLVSDDSFGLKENSFVISKNRRDILEKINMSIVTMHHEYTIAEICKKYMTSGESLYCTL